MRINNADLFVAQDATASVNSRAIDVSSAFGGSVQIVATGTVSGTLKLQASNDTARKGDGTVTPTNWTDIPGATWTVAAAGVFLIDGLSLQYMAIRAVWTNSASAAGAKVSAKAKMNGY